MKWRRSPFAVRRSNRLHLVARGRAHSIARRQTSGRSFVLAVAAGDAMAHSGENANETRDTDLLTFAIISHLFLPFRFALDFTACLARSICATSDLLRERETTSLFSFVLHFLFVLHFVGDFFRFHAPKCRRPII